VNESAAHRRRALDCAIFAADCNLVLATQKLPEHRFKVVKERRDKAIEEFADELLLALEAHR
jgi:hypothetical protein